MRLFATRGAARACSGSPCRHEHGGADRARLQLGAVRAGRRARHGQLHHGREADRGGGPGPQRRGVLAGRRLRARHAAGEGVVPAQPAARDGRDRQRREGRPPGGVRPRRPRLRRRHRHDVAAGRDPVGLARALLPRLPDVQRPAVRAGRGEGRRGVRHRRAARPRVHARRAGRRRGPPRRRRAGARPPHHRRGARRDARGTGRRGRARRRAARPHRAISAGSSARAPGISSWRPTSPGSAGTRCRGCTIGRWRPWPATTGRSRWCPADTSWACRSTPSASSTWGC